MQLPKFTTEEGRVLAGMIQDLSARIDRLERETVKSVIDHDSDCTTKEAKRGKS